MESNLPRVDHPFPWKREYVVRFKILMNKINIVGVRTPFFLMNKINIVVFRTNWFKHTLYDRCTHGFWDFGAREQIHLLGRVPVSENDGVHAS